MLMNSAKNVNYSSQRKKVDENALCTYTFSFKKDVLCGSAFIPIYNVTLS